MRRPAVFRVALAIVALLTLNHRAQAQVVPNDRWLTLETRHFRIHFTPPLEQMARRAGPTAERAFALLSRELVAPHGKVDLVIADNVDYTNGYATPFPSNRIVIYAHPPVDQVALRNYDDWSTLVITHELTHIFHLDRAAGFWKVGRMIFGRHPAFFPNYYMPAWVIEGLAVYYESRITGTGRLEGSEHYMVAHAAAQAGAFPRLGEISLATSRFPGGETVYAYGGFMFDYLSRTRGEKTIHDFVEQSSREIFPITLDGKAKRAFGISFDRAWRLWTDSLKRSTPRQSTPLAGWRELTRDGWILSSPRWQNDSSIIYGGATSKDVPEAYSVSLRGEEHAVGRRNSAGANVPLSTGGMVFSQPDYIDPYRLRNDLYVQRGDTQTRLTHGARVFAPDARRDGSIVAVQNVPGSTRLVRITPDGRAITPITAGILDVQWLEPRWSPDGSRITAVRIERGNNAQVVVIDTAGKVLFAHRFQNAVPANPSWSTDGDRLYFTSDHTGTMQIYSVNVRGPGDTALTRLSDVVSGLFNPEESPSSKWIAALHYRTDGYHLGVAPIELPRSTTRDTAIAGERAVCSNCRITEVGVSPVAAIDNGVVTSYSPWRSLLPTYWEPVIETGTGVGTRLGAATSGVDIVGRHSYFAQATINTTRREGEGFFDYRHAGLGQPYIDLSAEQAWDHSDLINSARRVVGSLGERSRIYSASATVTRPRARTFASLTFGSEFETRAFATDPDTLISHLPAIFSETFRYPSVFASAAWSNTRRPPLSISREDGVTLSAIARQRWRNATGNESESSPSRSIIGVGAAFKSLDLPGFAHHVIAVRGSAGYEDERAISAFGAGGLSGSALEVLAGISLGDQRRNFGVRGFPPSAERGIRAFAGSVEYRAPIAAPSRHVPYVPLLFDRISATAFADAGRAYCPRGSAPVCSDADANNPWLASIGAEVNLDAALYYDAPARIRFGVAAPVANRDYGRAKSVSVYLTFGSSF